MDRRDAIREQMKAVEQQIGNGQAVGAVTSATVFTLFLILGFKNPLPFTFTLVPYVVASLASIPLMIELNRLCKELTGHH